MKFLNKYKRKIARQCGLKKKELFGKSQEKPFTHIIRSSVKRLEFATIKEKDYMRVIWFETDPELLEDGHTEHYSAWYRLNLSKEQVKEFKESVKEEYTKL